VFCTIKSSIIRAGLLDVLQYTFHSNKNYIKTYGVLDILSTIKIFFCSLR